MPHRVAFILFGMIVCTLLADLLWLHWNLPLFLGKKFVELTHWIAFWR